MAQCFSVGSVHVERRHASSHSKTLWVAGQLKHFWPFVRGLSFQDFFAACSSESEGLAVTARAVRPAEDAFRALSRSSRTAAAAIFG